MHYKVLKGTDLFKKLNDLKNKMQDCKDKASDFAEKLGFDSYYKKSFVLAGSFYGLVPRDGKTKPKGYAWAFSDRTGNAVMPAKNTKEGIELLKQIDDLPTVGYDELNKLVGYKEEMSHRPAGNGRGGTKLNFYPVVIWRDKYIVVNVPDYSGKYKAKSDMIEILESEYNKLSK